VLIARTMLSAVTVDDDNDDDDDDDDDNDIDDDLLYTQHSFWVNVFTTVN